MTLLNRFTAALLALLMPTAVLAQTTFLSVNGQFTTVPTGSLTGTFPTSSLSGTISNSQLANMAAHTVKCNSTGSSAVPSDCTSFNIGSAPFILDANGNLLLGLSSALSNGDAQFTSIQSAGPSPQVGGNIGLFQFSNDTSSAFLGFFKTRATTKGTGQTTVQANDGTGEINFAASDGTNYIKVGYFTNLATGSISTGVVPSLYEWGLTNASGALCPTMRLTPAQHLLIGASGCNVSGFSDLNALTVLGAGDIVNTGNSSFNVHPSGSTNGGAAQINSNANFSSTVPVYGFWFNGSTGIGNPASNVTSVISNGTEASRWDPSGNFFVETSATTASAANAFIDTGTSPVGQLKRSTSSRRYKRDIRDYDRGIEALMKLRPVYYKGINDGNKQFAGLIAEEVNDAGLTEYVLYNKQGQPDALAYSNMVALLIKAVQQQQIEILALQNEVSSLKQRR